MKIDRAKLLVVLAFVVACGSPSSGGEPAPSPPLASSAAVTRPELNLRRLAGGKVAVELRAPSDRRPRMVDVRVRWSTGWKLQAQAAGAATTSAQKSLYVKPLGDTEARVIVLSSSSTERLGDGVLAELSLVGNGKGTVEIMPSPPMLAPAETEQGLHIGDPLSL